MKKRIGITQRVVYLADIDERRDVLDQRWYDFADAISVQLIPVPNNISSAAEYVASLKIGGIIFSGGNNIGISGGELLSDKTIRKDDVALERDQTEMHLLEWAINNQKPVVGVCRGFQFLNAFYGGSQSRVDPETHVATNHKVDIVEKEWETTLGTSKNVNSYHNWGVLNHELAGNLIPTAMCDNYVEGYQHQTHSLFGIMWHHERYKEFRKQDINFFKQTFR